MPKRERRWRNIQTYARGPSKGMKEFEVYTKTKTIENINLTTECGDMDSSVRWTTDTPQRLTLKETYTYSSKMI